MVNRTRLERAKKYIQKRQRTHQKVPLLPPSVPLSPPFIFVLSCHSLFAVFVGHPLFFHFTLYEILPLLFTLFLQAVIL